MPTTDEYLDQAAGLFIAALGDAEYTDDLVECYKLRFHSRMAGNVENWPLKVAADAAHLADLCTAHGERALVEHGTSLLPINHLDMLKAVDYVSELERADNGGKPTQYC